MSYTVEKSGEKDGVKYAYKKTVSSSDGPGHYTSSVTITSSSSHFNGQPVIEGKKIQPVNAYWGKKYGVDPSPSITSRRPQKAVSGPSQNYEEIRKQCLAEGALFEDPAFPASDESLFFSQRPPRPFEWKRPKELVKNPAFFVDGISRFDVVQGELGDCWLLAAIATLTLNEGLVYQVVPKDQSFDKDYCGLFHFKFWQYGNWVDVVVDDRLPTYNGRLVFLHSKERNEFWSALLEKAYAKLNGSYEALRGGSTSEAMEDCTGGVTEMYDLHDEKVATPTDLLQIVQKGKERLDLMACSIEADARVIEAELPNGLVRGHAYSITDVKTVTRGSNSVQLLRLRNPWGTKEWKGAWSDESPEWKAISASEKQSLGLISDDDGEFWMSYDDWLKQFDKIEICHLNPETSAKMRGKMAKHNWVCDSFEGSWVRGATAGGCRNYLKSFPCNPQFHVTLQEADEGSKDNKCTIIVALLQKNRRKQRKQGKDNLTIGYGIYKVDDSKRLERPLDADFITHNATVARSPSFINVRELTCRFKLDPGCYVLIPSTFEPNQDGEFMVRVFTEKPHKAGDVEEPTKVDPTVVDKPHPAIIAEEQKDDPLKATFTKLAGDDAEVDAWELQDILSVALKAEFKLDAIPLDICRSMIALMDVSRSGTLDLDEFMVLWNNVRHWKAIFQAHDKDNTGKISSFELRDMFGGVGYRVHSRVLKAMALRYAAKDGTMNFVDFLACAVKLKTMLDIFSERDTKKTGSIEIDKDAWTELTMYS